MLKASHLALFQDKAEKKLEDGPQRVGLQALTVKFHRVHLAFDISFTSVPGKESNTKEIHWRILRDCRGFHRDPNGSPLD